MIVLAIFIIAEFMSVVVFVAKAIHLETFLELRPINLWSMIINVLAVASDVSITVVFCFLLHRARNSLKRSNRMISMLIAFSVQTGALTSLCAIASLIAINAWPNTFIYICFFFLIGRLYCNSLLATLNVRKTIRGKGCGTLGISLNPISDLSTDGEINIRSGPAGCIMSAEACVYPKDARAHESIEAIEYVRKVEVHVHKDSIPFDRSEDQGVSF